MPIIADNTPLGPGRKALSTDLLLACELVPLKEVQPLTGYIRGGVTVLGAKKAYPVYVDETIELFDVVSISAGMRGLQVLLAPAHYLQATKGTLGAIADLS